MHICVCVCVCVCMYAFVRAHMRMYVFAHTDVCACTNSVQKTYMFQLISSFLVQKRVQIKPAIRITTKPLYMQRVAVHKQVCIQHMHLISFKKTNRPAREHTANVRADALGHGTYETHTKP